MSSATTSGQVETRGQLEKLIKSQMFVVIVVEKSERGPGDRSVPLMFVPKSAASSTSQEESGNLRRKRPKVEGGSNTTTAATAEVGSQTEKEEIDQEVAQMIFDTGEFFYDLGWNDREQVIVFIINHQTQFVNQLTLQEELNLILVNQFNTRWIR